MNCVWDLLVSHWTCCWSRLYISLSLLDCVLFDFPYALCFRLIAHLVEPFIHGSECLAEVIFVDTLFSMISCLELLKSVHTASMYEWSVSVNLSENFEVFLDFRWISFLPQGYLSSYRFWSESFYAGVLQDNIMITIAHWWHWFASLFIAGVPASKSISDRCRHLSGIAASRAVSGPMICHCSLNSNK